MSGIQLTYGDALASYSQWEQPTLIISDGPYGIGGYDGDPKDASALPDWYAPHFKEWSRYASPQTTLWFWNTELGWANTHAALVEAGWIYRACCVWDKGLAHAAGNTNTHTLRKFPVVTEVCVHYVRKPVFQKHDNPSLSAQDWLRAEWQRAGLPLSKANVACGVKNAATRKYLTSDHLWYFPPAAAFQQLADFANAYGDQSGRPYFSVDGTSPATGLDWEQLRGKFFCEAGVTNVWSTPAVRGKERLKTAGKAAHPNQKPLVIMDRLVRSCSEPGDVVWEPFGGLCSGSIAASALGRRAYAAEIDVNTYQLARDRISNEVN